MAAVIEVVVAVGDEEGGHQYDQRAGCALPAPTRGARHKTENQLI
jgi:hypothetical protein